MRTIKALACATAVVAGVATSMAQSNVYSLNVVGYYNVPCPADQLVFIANQLNTTNNTIASLIPNPPPGSQLYKFASGNWSAYTFDDLDLAWSPLEPTLAVGEGAMFKKAASSTITAWSRNFTVQ